jgi:hypothetical protein
MKGWREWGREVDVSPPLKEIARFVTEERRV